MKYIASCSGGKDSVCQLILAKQENEPLDEVVYCEVMFSREISGEVPEHRDFIYKTVKPYVENVLQVPFIVLRSRKTYLDVFNHIITRGENKGKTHGYAFPDMCAINRDCKIPPITKYWKAKGGGVIQYVGIAADEPARLARLRGTNKISLLEKYEISERLAREICRAHGLLSPVYEVAKRNGCWFCPNCSDDEWAHMIFQHEDMFDILVDLELNTQNICRRCLTRQETPTQLKRRILSYGEQLKLF